MRSIFIAFVALCMLTACDSTQSLRELREVTPVGDSYHQSLATGYRHFAEVKEANYDWWTSKYFADKGLMAAYGRDVLPEDPANWDIPATIQPEFTDARTKLIAGIAANKSTQPEATANAVVTYDRWVEVENNHWDVAKIEETRDAFYAALGKLSEVHTDEAASAAPVENTSTILYFPFDSATLGTSAKAALAEMVRYVKSAGNVSISINGHTDRAGSEAYNMVLSEKRAKYVMKALAASGVPEKWMKYFAFGESDPAVPTADGVPEPRNRRVEIFIE